MIVSFDAETYSPVDLNRQGADRYARDPATRCLMFAWHVAGDLSDPSLWLEGDPVPPAFAQLVASDAQFSGWNVIGFDRLIYNYILVAFHHFPPIDDDRWIDSMHRAAAANLPRGLDACARALKLTFDSDLKDKHRVVRITKADKTVISSNTRFIADFPDEHPATNKTTGKLTLYDDLSWLANRCVQDVWLEENVLANLPPWIPTTPWVRMPTVDRDINDRGIMMDRLLVEGLATAAATEINRLDQQMHAVTDRQVERTSTLEQLKRWLVSFDVPVPLTEQPEKNPDDEPTEPEKPAKGVKSQWRLNQNDIADLLALDLPDQARQALLLRAEAAKIPVKKLDTMLVCAGPDDRLRGALVLGGAQQTMRWSGAKWQPQNFPRDAFANPDEIKDPIARNQALATAIMVGRSGDADLIRLLYETERKDAQGRRQVTGVMTWISRMLRRTLCAPYGSLLLNGDFSQAEARITAWLAQQTDILETYATGGDVYTLTASGIFRISPADVTKPQRQAGKTVILAGGFGGGWKSMIRMAFKFGLILTMDEAQDIVAGFRKSNSAIQKYWYASDDAAADAVAHPGKEFFVPPLGLVSYQCRGDVLYCRLPSGRELCYRNPRLKQENWDDGKPKQRLSLYALTPYGDDYRSLYHTVLVENQVQAIEADLVGTGLCNMADAGLPVSLHVHDSIVAEIPEDQLDQLSPAFHQCMLAMPAWADGLPIAADITHGARFG